VLQLVPVEQVPTAKQSPLPLNVYMCVPPALRQHKTSPPVPEPLMPKCQAMMCWTLHFGTLRSDAERTTLVGRRLHGLAHIELNAIDLALDTAARFSSLPLDRVRTPALLVCTRCQSSPQYMLRPHGRHGVCSSWKLAALLQR